MASFASFSLGEKYAEQKKQEDASKHDAFMRDYVRKKMDQERAEREEQERKKQEEEAKRKSEEEAELRRLKDSSKSGLGKSRKEQQAENKRIKELSDKQTSEDLADFRRQMRDTSNQPANYSVNNFARSNRDKEISRLEKSLQSKLGKSRADEMAEQKQLKLLRGEAAREQQDRVSGEVQPYLKDPSTLSRKGRYIQNQISDLTNEKNYYGWRDSDKAKLNRYENKLFEEIQKQNSSLMKGAVSSNNNTRKSLNSNNPDTTKKFYNQLDSNYLKRFQPSNLSKIKKDILGMDAFTQYDYNPNAIVSELGGKLRAFTSSASSNLFK